MISNRCTRWTGDPERESSWLSSGNRTSSTSRFSRRRIVNRSSACPTGHRRSFSEWRIKSGVVMFSAYVDGEICRYTSGRSNQNAPSSPLKVHPMSADPPSRRKLLQERSEHAARNRSVRDGTPDGAPPLLRVPRGASRVRVHDGVSRAGVHLELVEEPVRVLGERSAVDVEQHRVPPALVESDRAHDPRLHLAPVLRGRGEALRAGEFAHFDELPPDAGQASVAREELGELRRRAGRMNDLPRRDVPPHDAQLTSDHWLWLPRPIGGGAGGGGGPPPPLRRQQGFPL